MEAKYIIFYLLSLLSFKIYSTSCCNSCKGSQDNTKKQNSMTNNNHIKTNPNLNTNIKTTNKKNKNNNTEKNNINTKLSKYYKKKDTADKKNYNNIDLNKSQVNKIKNSKIKNEDLNDEKEEKKKEDKSSEEEDKEGNKSSEEDKEGNKSSEEENKSVKEEEEEDKSIKEKEEKEEEDKSIKKKEEKDGNKSSEEEDSDDESVNNDTKKRKWEIQINNNKIDITKDELSKETFKDLNIVNCNKYSVKYFTIFKINSDIYNKIQLNSNIKFIFNDENLIDICDFTSFSIKSNKENYYIILYEPANVNGIFTGDNLSNINEIKLIYLNKNIKILNEFFSYDSDGNDENSDKNKIKIKKIYILETFFSGKVTDMRAMFSDFKELIKIEGLGNLKTDSCKKMCGMFQNCSSIEEIDLSNWNISYQADLCSMFYKCKNLKKVKFPEETFSSQGSIAEMFVGCENLETIDLRSIKEHKYNYFNLEGILGKGCNNIQEIIISDGLFHELIYTEIGDYKNLKKIVIYINDKENYNKILNEYEEQVAIFNKNLNTQGYKLNIEEKKELTIYTYSRNNP